MAKDKLPDGTLILCLEWDGWVVAGKNREWPSLQVIEQGAMAQPRKRENKPLALRCYVVPPEYAGLPLATLVQCADNGSLHKVSVSFTPSTT